VVTAAGDNAWSWAENADAVASFRNEADGLVGEVIARVTYVDVDYRADEFRNGTVGPRRIDRDIEWGDPTWRHAACDSVDHGVEIETLSGRLFTVSWDAPGAREGLGLRELPLFGNAVNNDADVAIWDVSVRSSWVGLVGREVTTVELHYAPWDESGALWCDWISVHVGEQRVEFLLGEGAAEVPEILASADNVAVVFDRSRLPGWLVERQRL
jgi:hypothetical protein